MKIILDPNLERALLRAIAEGTCPASTVDKDELSKKGKAVHDAMLHLFRRGAKAPLKPASIALTAHTIAGFPQASADAYLRSFKEFSTGEEIVSILATAREKSALVEVINQAGSQLASGRLDVAALQKAFGGSKAEPDVGIRALSEGIRDKFPKPPRGHELLSFPFITAATNGLAGIWVIGGEPGVGKSTLGVQIAIDVAASIPVIYHDIDGTGEAYFIDHLRQVYDGSVKGFKRATERFFYRDSIHDLESTVARFKPPALFVADSIQTLPVIGKNGSKESTDEWLTRMKDLTKRGYSWLLISEKPRSHYGAAEMGGYKNTGAIEYAGTICAHMIADEDDDNLIRFVIVKNRHGPLKGHVVNLIRDDDKVFWFREEKIRAYTDRKKKHG